MKDMNAQKYCSPVGLPPRPPCWQDFNQTKHDGKKKGKKESKPQISYEKLHYHPMAPPTKEHSSKLAGDSKKKSKKSNLNRSKLKLRRTRSEPNICDNDLPHEPEVEMTLNLSDVVLPRYNAPVVDFHHYLKENYRRCQKWLASVEPCYPLGDTVPDVCPLPNHQNISKTSLERSTNPQDIGQKKPLNRKSKLFWKRDTNVS